MLQQLIWVAGGGAMGAMLRFLTSIGMHALLGRGFAYGTLTVNVLGSFIMGLLTEVILLRVAWPANWRSFLLVGLLGAFTTFSTFSIETLNYLENGAVTRALMNIALNLLLCLGAVWLGVLAGRQV